MEPKDTIRTKWTMTAHDKRVFLQQLREPTEAMKHAMLFTPPPPPDDNRPLWLAIWQNAIDAAITEAKD